MGVAVKWSRLGLGSIVGFLVGWYFLGLFWAVVVALLVMFAMGIIKVD